MALIAAILFDVNETIIHQVRTECSHMAATYATLAPHQWHITFEEFEAAWKQVHGSHTRRFQEGCNLVRVGQLDDARVKLYEPWYRENIVEILAVLKFPASNRLIEEITWAFQDSWVGGLTMPKENREVLEQLAREFRLGVVTNFQQPDVVPDILNQFGLASLFDPVIISATEGYRKPHPDLFRLALTKLGMTDTPECVAYVGDNIGEDVDGAARAGLFPILIDTTGMHASFVKSVLRIGRLAELPDVLRTFSLARI